MDIKEQKLIKVPVCKVNLLFGVPHYGTSSV